MSSEDRPSDQTKKGFGGLSGMVSDVETTTPSEDPSTSAEAAREAPPGRRSEPPSQRQAPSPPRSAARPYQQPSAPRSSSSGVKWLIGIVVVIGFIWLLAESGEESSTLRPRPRVSSPAPQVNAPEPRGLDEAKPLPGTNNVLTTSQIRYCLAEDIRLGAAKDVVSPYVDTEVDRFNAMVTDYNIRCGEFRYREGTLQRARSDVERHRMSLQAEGRSRFRSGLGGAGVGSGSSGRTDVEWEALFAELIDEQRKAPEPDPTVRSIQQKLNALGYDAGLADGLMGGRTRAAVAAFQKDQGMTVDGVAGPDLLQYLSEGSQRRRSAHTPPNQTSDAPRIAETVVRERSGSNAAKPDLSAVDSWEQAAIERACNPARLYSGPADYYSCLRRELRELQAHSGKPDLSGVSSSERTAIEKACNSARLYSGPGDYYSCLRRELRELQAHSGKPDLSAASPWEREAIEKACNSARLYSGPGDYYSCLRRELRDLQAHSGKPDLSKATVSERQTIDQACQSAQLYSGPGHYYSCLRRELTKAGYR